MKTGAIFFILLCIARLGVLIDSMHARIHVPVSKSVQSTNSTYECILKIALAGGLAGGITNAILYPIDTMKTMRQSDPTLKSMWDAWHRLRGEGILRAYRGVKPAVFGAVPSSAIYFGTYESMKLFLVPLQLLLPRQCIHMLAAGTGNLLSSLVLVPKDLVKIRMQASAAASTSKRSVLAIVREIYRREGLRGFYPSYRATLAKNIPSAVVLYPLDILTLTLLPSVFLRSASRCTKSSRCSSPLAAALTYTW